MCKQKRRRQLPLSLTPRIVGSAENASIALRSGDTARSDDPNLACCCCCCCSHIRALNRVCQETEGYAIKLRCVQAERWSAWRSRKEGRRIRPRDQAQSAPGSHPEDAQHYAQHCHCCDSIKKRLMLWARPCPLRERCGSLDPHDDVKEGKKIKIKFLKFLFFLANSAHECKLMKQ